LSKLRGDGKRHLFSFSDPLQRKITRHPHTFREEITVTVVMTVVAEVTVVTVDSDGDSACGDSGDSLFTVVIVVTVQ
jgi:hypothetical protein